MLIGRVAIGDLFQALTFVGSKILGWHDPLASVATPVLLDSRLENRNVKLN